MHESMLQINTSILFDIFVVLHKNLTALDHLNSLCELEKNAYFMQWVPCFQHQQNTVMIILLTTLAVFVRQNKACDCLCNTHYYNIFTELICE